MYGMPADIFITGNRTSDSSCPLKFVNVFLLEFWWEISSANNLFKI
jgi:hypothetical protein